MFIVAGTLLGAPNALAAPSTEAVDAINDRYSTFGGAGSLLGAPVGEAVDVPGGAEQGYQGVALAVRLLKGESVPELTLIETRLVTATNPQ
jgi:ABC-type sugar transport system substrate-binding protein